MLPQQLLSVYGVLSSDSHRSRQLRRPLLSPTNDASVPPKNALRPKDAVEQTHPPGESSDRQGRRSRAQGKRLTGEQRRGETPPFFAVLASKAI